MNLVIEHLVVTAHSSALCCFSTLFPFSFFITAHCFLQIPQRGQQGRPFGRHSRHPSYLSGGRLSGGRTSGRAAAAAAAAVAATAKAAQGGSQDLGDAEEVQSRRRVPVQPQGAERGHQVSKSERWLSLRHCCTGCVNVLVSHSCLDVTASLLPGLCQCASESQLPGCHCVTAAWAVSRC